MMISATLKGLYLSVIIIGAIGSLLFLSLASPLIINNSDFSIYNTGWNGCSTLAVETYHTGKFVPLLSYDETTMTPIQRSFVTYDCNPLNTSLICIGPKTEFTSEEVYYIDWFLRTGGIVFLSDDFGAANSLLTRLNTSTRFSNDLLLDFSFEKNASFATVFIFPERTHPIINNVTSLLLNYPSSIQPSNTASILVSSSNLSWLDTTFDGRYDENEEKGPFPLLTVETYGKGTLIVSSTPSVFINSMKEYLDNRLFVEQILDFITSDRSSVIIDEGHRDAAVPFTLAISFPGTIDTTTKISILLLVTILYLLFFTTLPRRTTMFIFRHVPGIKRDEDNSVTTSIVDEILQDHPQWERRTLETIIERMRET
jgi:hypothetical protein